MKAIYDFCAVYNGVKYVLKRGTTFKGDKYAERHFRRIGLLEKEKK